MLKWAAKNRLFYSNQRNTKLELRIKLSNVFLVWFVANNSANILSQKWRFYIICKLFVFFGKIVKLLEFVWLCELKRKKKIFFRKINVKKVLNCLAKLYQLIHIYSLKNMLIFYRYFLIFCWFFNDEVLNYNLTKNFILFKVLNKPTLSYMYNQVLKYNSLQYSFSKIKSACFVTGRSRAVVRAFKLSRFKIREFANLGLFIGLSKSSW